ncbi:MAG TPA: enoyl-CoA hydratase-related protein [Candidatus Thermoplasmatota archaeon]|nr:enoyl-CoA hydratase-related protein [Candidatus Thermoplasmatota archaeon]
MPVRFEEKGHVAVLTIDRPEAANAIDPETHDALVAAWTRFRDDDRLRVAVLTGAGEKSFCAGADLKRMGEWYARVPAERRREVWDREPGLGGITRNLDPGKPTIAAVNGHCLGGGLELALACDLRYASDNATFALPETKWGILPGQGGTQRLARVVGPAHALEMILSANAIDAQRALAIGLVNRVVPARELLPAALALAETIASRAPRAVRAAREALWRGLDATLAEGLRVEQALADPLRDSEDNREARKAFAEKREPNFSGR